MARSTDEVDEPPSTVVLLRKRAEHPSLVVSCRLGPGDLGLCDQHFVRVGEASSPRSSRRGFVYLQFVGVEPGWQGQGVGSALLCPILERCDRERVPAYLEASRERNVVLYERHGFAVVEEVGLPGGGPPLWRMWREPAAS